MAWLLISSFIISYILIKLIIKNAIKLGLQDIPNDRSVHNEAIPRGAGIGFILSIFLVFILFKLGIFLEYWYIFLSIFLVFVVGILDDHRDAPPKAKFIVIIVAAILLYINDIYIPSLGIYFGYDLLLWYFALPFSIFAIVGFTNALNLIDGLDGLAGIISIIILIVFSYIGYVFNDILILSLSLVTIFSLISFMIFNWQPAKIFMGDSGSLSLGIIVAIVAILSLKYIHPITILYLAALPIVDTLVVMIRRIKKGFSPFSADKTHIHHIMYNFFNKNVKKTVVFLSLLQLMFSFFGYISAVNIIQNPNGMLSFALIVGFVIIVVLTYMVFTGMKRRQKVLKRLNARKNKRK